MDAYRYAVKLKSSSKREALGGKREPGRLFVILLDVQGNGLSTCTQRGSAQLGFEPDKGARHSPALVGIAQIAQRAVPQRVKLLLTAAGLGRKLCVRALQVVHLCRPDNGDTGRSGHCLQVLLFRHFQVFGSTTCPRDQTLRSRTASSPQTEALQETQSNEAQQSRT